jgi:hypothetical protein
MKNKVIRKVFFPLILAKDQKDCDGFGKIKNEIRKKKIRKEKMVRPAEIDFICHARYQQYVTNFIRYL